MNYSEFQKNYTVITSPSDICWDLQFFAEDSSTGQKTEEASDRKLRKAREEGQVAKSQDITTATTLFCTFMSIYIFGSFIEKNILRFMVRYFQMDSGMLISSANLRLYITEGIYQFFFLLSPVFLISFLSAFFINVVQVGWVISWKAMALKFDRLNPVSGFQRIFSKRSIAELIKALVKLVIIAYVPYSVIKNKFGVFYSLVQMALPLAYTQICYLIFEIGVKISIVFFLFAFADLAYEKWEFSEKMKMSKYDVKQEHKDMEGNPQIKGEMRRRAMELIFSQMAKELPTADVVITNPVHVAVALKYRQGIDDAPKVIGKGKGHIAQKIKGIAKENEISIIENIKLARGLYDSCEIGDEIPEQYFASVVEIYTYIHNTDKKNRKVV